MRFGEFAERFKEVMATFLPNLAVDIGERHLTQFSAPGRVWIAPVGRGSWARPLKMSAGSIFELKRGIIVRVWGFETVPDADRWDSVEDIGDAVLNAVDRVAPGRVEPVELIHLTASEETFGEQDAFAFTLSRGVPKIRAVATLPVLPLEPTSPPNPLNPNNELGTVTVTTSDNSEG